MWFWTSIDIRELLILLKKLLFSLLKNRQTFARKVPPKNCEKKTLSKISARTLQHQSYKEFVSTFVRKDYFNLL